MSEIRRASPECPDAATLAAFVDGTLEDREREAVERHLAHCEAGYEVFVEATRLGADSGMVDLPVAPTHGRRHRPAWTILVPLAAAAGVALVVWLRPFGLAFTADQRAERAVALLARADAAQRPAIGRLGEPFGWAPAPQPTRSATASRQLSPDAAAAVARIRQLAEASTSGATLHALGVAHLMTGDLDAAIATLSDAAADAPDVARVHADLAAAWLERWNRDRQPADANAALDQANAALLHAPDDAAALFNRAWAWEALGDRTEAVAAWQAVLDHDPGSGWATEASTHLDRLRRAGSGPIGLNDATSGEVMAALARTRPSALHDALDAQLFSWAAAQQSGGGATLPGLADRIAAALTSAGRDRFRPDLVRAVRSAPSPATRTALAATIAGWRDSQAAYAASDYVRSRAVALAAADAARVGHVPVEPLEAQAVWARFWSGGQRPAAAAEARGLLGRLQARGYSFSAGRLLYLLGVETVGRAYLSDGLALYTRARDEARHAGADDLLATIDTGLAEGHRHVGDLSDAWRSHAEALSLLDGLPPRLRHLVLSGAAISSLEGREYAAAWSYATLLIANADQWKHPAGFVGSRVQMIRALVGLGRRADARAYVDGAASYLDEDPSVAEQARYRSELDLVNGLALADADPPAAATAFGAAAEGFDRAGLSVRVPAVLLSRARAHVAAGDVPAARADLEAGLHLFEDQRPLVRDAQLSVTRLDEAWDLYGDSIALAADDPDTGLSIAERARGRALLDAVDRHQPVAPARTADFGASLPAATTALVYAVLTDRLVAWTVGPTAVHRVDRMISSRDLRRLVDRVSGELQTGRAGPAASELARLVIPEDVPLRPDDTLAVLPDGPLYQVPFAALPRPGASGPLAPATRLLIAPSLTMLAAAAETPAASPPEASALVVGYGAPRGDLPALPAIDDEVRAVAALYDHPIVLRGASATASAVLAALPHASVVHIAGHARSDDAHPSDSMLFVAPEGARAGLRPEDVARLHLRPGTVVVLSGCETARGAVYRGEGAMNWARPFLAAGASAVIANLWPVRDEDAARAAQAVHEALRAGLTPAAAVAQLYRSGSRLDAIGAMEVFGGSPIRVEDAWR